MCPPQVQKKLCLPNGLLLLRPSQRELSEVSVVLTCSIMGIKYIADTNNLLPPFYIVILTFPPAGPNQPLLPEPKVNPNT